MKRFLLISSIALFAIASAWGTEPLKDYSFVRGVCYPGGWRNSLEQIERELGYAQRLNINSTRIWLSPQSYERNPEQFIEQLQTYIRTAYTFGINTMPILFNGNMIDPVILEADYRKTADAYVKAVIEAVKDEPGLFVWDIMNEPLCSEYYSEAPNEKEKKAREDKIWEFVRHYCKLVKKLDGKTAVTVGVTYAHRLEPIADLVDVLSFHDYFETRAKVQATYDAVKEVSARHGNKPIINSELCCIGRANPYDMALELCEKNKAGFYVFDLIVGGYWGDVHGIFYTDGTIRDPAIVSALMGFYRNKDPKTRVRQNPNKEGYVVRALHMLQEAMKDETKLFRGQRSSTDEILEACEWCANLLEGSEMVPMIDAPTVKIRAWQEQPEKERDLEAIRQFAYELAQTLKKYCQIL
ncbi:hypothetical protein LJB97_00880 [Parabacteroides sp. OttesenSCG-928-O15]|nr:hypothetical protein [Parabacteroides sp. OttesenSCG-928-O15]